MGREGGREREREDERGCEMERLGSFFFVMNVQGGMCTAKKKKKKGERNGSRKQIYGK